jgi:DNA-binding NtrC family response regulator
MSDREKPLVMVIDPDPKTSTSLLPLLVAEGYRAVSCSAIGRSLTAILRQHPDLVVVSTDPENCDGMILIGRIKEMSPDTRAILLIDPKDWPSLVDAFDAGADDLQRRQPGGRKLLESVRRLLDLVNGPEAGKGLVIRAL